MPHKWCACADKGCPVHPGTNLCFNMDNITRLFRVDMHDSGGTLFCEQCRDDALKSGLFSLVEERRQ